MLFLSLSSLLSFDLPFLSFQECNSVKRKSLTFSLSSQQILIWLFQIWFISNWLLLHSFSFLWKRCSCKCKLRYQIRKKPQSIKVYICRKLYHKALSANNKGTKIREEKGKASISWNTVFLFLALVFTKQQPPRMSLHKSTPN